ncbi:MAG: heavy metal sensor histidine kinase [Betaproteobacteria bacterium]|nr:MAG: heavy metal sensor histidine kinase [Betaproteobacteria bacterium]
MSARKPRSLRRWLSVALAVLTLSGLGGVGAAVFLATGLSLTARQAATVRQHREVIEHLAEEVRTPGDLDDLRHKLDDFFVGRSDLRLEIRSPSGQAIFERDTRRMRAPAHQRQSVFELASPAWPAGGAKAELLLDVSADEQLLQWLAWTLVASALIGAAVISLAAAWLVRRALEPVDALARQATSLVPEHLDARLDGTAQAAEMQPLVAQFNAVLARLQRAYRQMEAFNADVAHELRTPLATLIGQTELALEGSEGAAELREVMASNLEELQHLSSLVHDMLFIANADRGARIRAGGIEHLATLAHEVAEYHEAALLDAGLTVAIRGDAAARVDGRLIRLALSNLLSNATRYATANSEIEIRIMRDASGDIALAVTNSGIEIAEEHLPRIFDRFYRVDTSRIHGGARNYGLGLAIVAAIAHMHDGRTFARSSGGYTTIGLVLPAKVE